jgi:hypothetical protein
VGALCECSVLMGEGGEILAGSMWMFRYCECAGGVSWLAVGGLRANLWGGGGGGNAGLFGLCRCHLCELQQAGMERGAEGVNVCVLCEVYG